MRRLIRNVLFSSDMSDKALGIAVYALMFFGLICTTSAGISSNSNVSTTISDFLRNLIIVFVGIVVYHFCSNTFKIEKFTLSVMNWIVWGELVLLLSAWILCRFVFGAINSNYSWISIPGIPFSIQPSEFAKVVMILVVAVYLCDHKFRKIKSSFTIMWRPLLILLLYCVVIFALQKDNGSALVVFILSALVLLIPSNRLLRVWQWLVLLGGVGLIFVYVYFMSESGQAFLTRIGFAHIAARFEAVKNPSYTSDATREIFYSLLGISKGNWFGVGLGDSVQKFGYLVSSDADYIFAIIAEELGLVGIGLVFLLYGIIIFRLVHFSRLVNKESDKVILMGTVFYLFIHFFFTKCEIIITI